MGDASHVAAIMLLFGAASADAQVTPPPANPAGAYQRLSAGNQKVARALFEAQKAPSTVTTTSGSGRTTTATPSSAAAASGPAPKPLTLDQIAAMKQTGSGWEHVFKQMRAQGLIAERSIAQVVSRYNETSRTPSASVVTTGGASAQSARGTPAVRPSATLAGSNASIGASK